MLEQNIWKIFTTGNMLDTDDLANWPGKFSGRDLKKI